MTRLVLVLAAAAALAACRGGGGEPGAVLESYGAALRARDYEAAYGMMSEAFRSKYSQDEFVRMMKQSGREAGETAARLDRGFRAIEISAEFSYGLGDTMRLVQEDGSWRIASNPLELYSQATPRDALRSFVRAYQLKRWDVMLGFVPTRYRERMTVAQVREQFDGSQREQIAAMMKTIAANLDAPIVEKGKGEAHMAYGERAEVKFALEDGRWKIQDLD
jgi:hypothetical protein